MAHAYAYDYQEPTLPTPPSRASSPEAALAASIIRQALGDAWGTGRWGSNGTNRRSALVFLAGGPDLTFWCDVAGLDLAVVLRLARQALQGAGSRPPAEAEARSGERPRPSGPPRPRAVPEAAGAVELEAVTC